MSFLRFHDRLGEGGFVRAGNYTLFGSSGLVPDGNEEAMIHDVDTDLVTGSFNNGAYWMAAYVDYVDFAYTYSIDSIYLYDSDIRILITAHDLNIHFDVRDDFYGAVTFINMFAGDDRMIGNRFADFFQGGRGDDWLSGNGGRDKLYGQAGHDRVDGGGGNDVLGGNAGRDDLFGGGGNDLLMGGTGADLLLGGHGADQLRGGSGRDILVGGEGEDRFVFLSVRDSGTTGQSMDRITDFDRGSDLIDLRAIDASTVFGGNNAFAFKGRNGIGTSDIGEIAYRRVDLAGTANDHTLVLIDTDGDTGVEMTIRLNGLYTLSGADFLL